MKDSGRCPDLEMKEVEEIEVNVACDGDGTLASQVEAWVVGLGCGPGSLLLRVLHKALLFSGLFHCMYNQRVGTD